MTNRIKKFVEKPPAIWVKSYPNLDSLFGDVFDKLPGEPISPHKIATFYLLRLLFETHFGRRDQKSFYDKFAAEEKYEIFKWLFALMSSEEELSYKGFREATRIAFDKDRRINVNFYSAMEQIASGEADVNLSMQDEFYTNRHVMDDEIEQKNADIDDRVQLKFTSHCSYAYRWLKKLLHTYTSTKSIGLFSLSEMMRNWLRAKDDNIVQLKRLGSNLPHEINSSMRARNWVAKNIHHIQNSPRHADAYDVILNYVKIIQKHQTDVVGSYLLESLVHIQLKDCASAVKAMKTFFELVMMELNEDVQHLFKTYRLTVPDTRTALMYAPILVARIFRLFGDYSRARSLLQEGIQQAQLSQNVVCHQMGNLELHAVDIIGSEPLLENKIKQSNNHTEVDRRVVRKPLAHIEDVHWTSRSGPAKPEVEEDYELASELDSIGKMIMLLKGVSDGTYQLKFSQNAENGIACPLASDMNDRGRTVSAYGNALVTSNMIRNGMYVHAKSLAKEALRDNQKPAFESESFAVITTNLAYSNAAIGNYSEALELIEIMKKLYPDNRSWQSNRHVSICSAIVKFEKAFLQNKYHECRLEIIGLTRYSEIEYTLRHALLLGALRRHADGIRMLREMKVYDIRGRIRVHMQLASMYTAIGSYEKSSFELEEAMRLTEGTTLLDIPPMILRRKATMLMASRKFIEALEIVNAIIENIDKTGSYVEKVCFYLTAAICSRMTGQDSRCHLTRARSLIRNNKWPSMEKLLLTELVTLHVPGGLMPNPDIVSKICEQFEKMNDGPSGRCEWLLI